MADGAIDGDGTDGDGTDGDSADGRRSPRRQARGAARRDVIVRAAAELILHEGPGALTHRAVAARAGVPLAATTYYFTGLDDLVAAAGQVVVDGWVQHARDVADRALREETAPRDLAAVLVDAVLLATDEAEVRGFYEHLVGAGRYPTLARAYAHGRGRLDAAVAHVLFALGEERVSPGVLVAVVDGAAVSALSEGRDVRALAVRLVAELLAGRDDRGVRRDDAGSG
jgi:DNA-binding transcriptional regulator YbjK